MATATRYSPGKSRGITKRKRATSRVSASGAGASRQRVLAEQLLAEPVLHVEPDDRLPKRADPCRFDEQRHALAAAHERDGPPVSSTQANVGDARPAREPRAATSASTSSPAEAATCGSLASKRSPRLDPRRDSRLPTPVPDSRFPTPIPESRRLSTDHRVEVRLGDVARGTVHAKPAPIEPDHPLAEALDGRKIVAHEQEGAAIGAETFEVCQALLHETDVAHRQRLVDDHHVGIDMGHDREGQAHVHAARVGADG